MLSFEITGTKGGAEGRWKITGANVADAHRRATAQGITVKEASFLPGDSPATPDPLRPPPRKPTPENFIRIKPAEAFVWGFWAGLGAWFGMVVLSFLLLMILAFCGAIALHH